MRQDDGDIVNIGGHSDGDQKTAAQEASKLFGKFKVLQQEQIKELAHIKKR